MTTQGLPTVVPFDKHRGFGALSLSLARRVAIPSAIGYRLVHGLRSPAPRVSLWPVGSVTSPSLGGIGEAHAPTMRCSRRRGTPSLFQAFVPGAADLVSLDATNGNVVGIVAKRRWEDVENIPLLIKNPRSGGMVRVNAIVDDDLAFGLLVSLSDRAVRALQFNEEERKQKKVWDEREWRANPASSAAITIHICRAEVSFGNTVVSGDVQVTPGWTRTVVHRHFLETIPEAVNLEPFKKSIIDLVSLRSVFISYSHKDKRFVRGLARALMMRGIKVWIDEGEVLIGESLISKLRTAIDEVDFVLAVISNASIKSEWVRRELDIAMNQEIDGRTIKVLPVLRDNCDLPGFLKGKLWADFRKPWYRTRSIKTIMRAIDELASNIRIEATP